MMIWNASGVPVWQVAFVWAGVILFWGLVIWAGYVIRQVDGARGSP